jgi:hypothetical protein
MLIGVVFRQIGARVDILRGRSGLVGPAVLLIGLFVLLWSKASSPQPQYAPLSAYFDYGQASVPVSQVTPLPASTLEVIQRSDADRATGQIDLVLEAELYRDELGPLGDELQAALDYVEERTGIQAQGRIKLILSQDEGCGFHGVTYSDVRVVYVFSCAGIPRQRVVNIAAHEFVHQLEQDRYGPPHLSADLALSEGFATWGAGKYWLGGNPDFATFAREYRNSGTAIALGTHYSAVGLNGMNILYYEWAAFVDYLIVTYGRERFDALYVSGGGAPGAASYAAVTGRSFGDLENEWIAALER